MSASTSTTPSTSTSTSTSTRDTPAPRDIPRPGAVRLTSAAITTLVARDLLRFVRQPSRIVGALSQPLLLWLVIGSGYGGTMRSAGEAGYLGYFFPGVVAMVVLFTAIFSTMSVIEDRHAGFLQAVLVAPAPRLALVLGKTLGGTLIALFQGGLFLLLSPWAGFPLGNVHWPAALATLALLSLGLTALGFALAWAIDSTQGYHAVMSVLLMPLWIVSGAMFPAAKGGGWLATVMTWNPVAYGVAGLRRALAGGALAPGLGVPGATAARELMVCAGFAIGCIALAALASSAPSRRGRPARTRGAKP